jgi:alpha-tubulin suppressor-like RCC1 family protein
VSRECQRLDHLAGTARLTIVSLALGLGACGGGLTPTPVAGGLTFTSLAVGGFHTCGLTSGGAAYCWGLNDYGQLGDGTIGGPPCNFLGQCSRLTPTPVAGGLAFISLTVGAEHTCGLTSGGAAYCWGGL